MEEWIQQAQIIGNFVQFPCGGDRPASRTRRGLPGGGEAHLDGGRIDGDGGDADASVGRQQGLEERGVHNDLRPADRGGGAELPEIVRPSSPTSRESLNCAPITTGGEYSSG
jgi:hypothetical protein